MLDFFGIGTIYVGAPFIMILVPLMGKRHCLYSNEIPEVVKGVKLRLEKLLEERVDMENAQVAFRAFYRLQDGKPGRPKYLNFS
jgi:hypothetical protein